MTSSAAGIVACGDARQAAGKSLLRRLARKSRAFSFAHLVGGGEERRPDAGARVLVGTETFEPPHAPGRHHDHPHHASANDLVGVGFARSMARHGGNVTGVSILATELDAKRLEILRAALPSAKLVGLIADPGNSAERHLGAAAGS